MKKPLLLLLSLCMITTLFAQQSGKKMYVLQFKDKGVNTRSAINPSAYLSDKSVERRLKQQIAFDESDIPVNEAYINDVSKTGARILTRSRWFNTVVIEATPEMATSVSALPFVTDAKPLGDGLKSGAASEKPLFEAEKTNPWTNGIPKKATADFYDYGAAFNQINQLNGQYLHNEGFRGQGMTIAVLDAGFNSVDIMTCFDSLRANSQIKGTRDFAQPGNNVYGTSMHTHGTSVLSCMGSYVSGEMIGTAPKADYWLLRSEVGETESVIEEYYWVSAAEFADSIGADLINSSLGYTTFDDPSTNHSYADMDGNTTFITIGADKAAEKGILVVNSAGNSGGDPWRYIGAPADGDSVFTIGAVDAAGQRAYFSSVGPTSDGRIKPTVSAQGMDAAIYFPGGFGTYGNGTSFSSPIICGITACLWQSRPDLNNMAIIEALKTTASQAGKSSPDSLLGWGIPNYEAAYASIYVHNQTVDKQLQTYPNPLTDKLTLGFSDTINGKYKVEIIDVQGKIVYADQGVGNAMRSLQINDLGYLLSGIYLVKVSDKAWSYSARIVKM
jgi:hypothetical protein